MAYVPITGGLGLRGWTSPAPHRNGIGSRHDWWGWRNESGSWFQRRGDAYLNERSVIFNEDWGDGWWARKGDKRWGAGTARGLNIRFMGVWGDVFAAHEHTAQLFSVENLTKVGLLLLLRMHKTSSIRYLICPIYRRCIPHLPEIIILGSLTFTVMRQNVVYTHAVCTISAANSPDSFDDEVTLLASNKNNSPSAAFIFSRIVSAATNNRYRWETANNTL